MNDTALTQAQVWMEYIPAHRLVGLYDLQAVGYGDLERREDSDKIEGILESMVPF